MKEKWKNWFRRDNLLILILSGVLLFIITLPTESEEEKEKKEQEGGTRKTVSGELQPAEKVQEDYAVELEKQLEETLCQMAGVGKVKVMITLQSSEELVVEKDAPMSRSNTSENDSAGGNRIVTQMDSSESTVYTTVDGENKPYVIKTILPKVEGVVVVAQGADNGTVNKNITEMVQALFNVEAHKVKVVKMASVN